MTDDNLRAELESLQASINELKRDLQDAQSTLGEPVSDESIGQLIDQVLRALRNAGNAALATTYLSAWQNFEAARLQLERQTEVGEFVAETIHAMNDARAEFERVQRDVLAILDRLDEGA